MPRPKKPPADPVPLLRSEFDLDKMIVALEAHKTEADRLGKLLRTGKLDPASVIDQAAANDAQLYRLADQMLEERESEILAVNLDLQSHSRTLKRTRLDPKRNRLRTAQLSAGPSADGNAYVDSTVPKSITV